MLGTKLKYGINDKYKISSLPFFFFLVINEWIARTSQIVINDTFIYKLYVNKLKINTPNITH